MYDEYARSLVDLIPDLLDLNRTDCRRALSKAYFYIIRSRIGITQTEEDSKDLENVKFMLRRMVDVLESVSVFDHLNGQDHPEGVETASAFVAAEALALLSNMTKQDPISDYDIISNYYFYTSIEAALLYMIGGYDIDALSVVKDLSFLDSPYHELDEISSSLQNNALFLADRILALCRGNVRQPRNDSNLLPPKSKERNYDYDLLIKDIRAKFYFKIGKSIDSYLNWLGGYDDYGLEFAISSLKSVQITALSKDHPNYQIFSDIYHLSSLLLATINRTSKRSLIHSVPAPNPEDTYYSSQFDNFLLFRARGDENHSSRPFLWPSSIEYVRNCLPGPNTDAVISMPTGSGKSFIAELATTNALSSGWVLYLAPTNALAHQIQHDLSHSLAPFEHVSIRAFVGSEEYTTLLEEQLILPDNNFVAVMTPEKCSLAVRLYPEQFTHCSLCVFDECHLLNDKNRGIVADVLIAQLTLIASNIRFLLMSAMVNNPEELAEWLNSIHHLPIPSKPLSIKWRPSRTMRGLLVVDQDPYKSNLEDAKKTLSQLPATRVNQKFSTPLALIAGLSGPWTMDGPPDYRTTQLPVYFNAKASKRKDDDPFESWKNRSSILLSEMLASYGIPTLCFILSSRHHTFSCAESVTREIPNKLGLVDAFPSIIEAWLSISDAEFGIETSLRSLLRKGIAVHSSAMLTTEQLASEWMFSHNKAQLIFATGTLAQGLNLPAIAVVVAGTSMGDSRNQYSDKLSGINRVDALILNGFGRAGRPGFSNQGIAILVSDIPFLAKNVETLDPTKALERYSVLGEPDATVNIQSPIENFIDNVFSNEMMHNEVTIEELTLTSLLAEYNSEDYNSGLILYNTFGGYKKRSFFTKSKIEQVRTIINTIREEYFIQENTPEWINKVAMKSGVDFFRALKIWQAYNFLGKENHEVEIKFDVIDWANLFFDVMAQLPPQLIVSFLPEPTVKRDMILTRMRKIILTRESENSIPWDIPSGWLELWNEIKSVVIKYMDGANYLEIAEKLIYLSPFEVSNKRTEGDAPIPMVFNFINKIIDQLAIDAGCFSAIKEQLVIQKYGEDSKIPESLQALPLCIRNGCNNLGSLSWYRFGYRERVCAHALEATFPVPADLDNDTERSLWVHRTRTEWLSGNIFPETHPILDFIKTVLLESDK